MRANTETTANGVERALSVPRLGFLSLRPRQWTKNLIIYLAYFFSLHDRFPLAWSTERDLFLKTTAGFFLFCLLSGAIYIINDLADAQRDQLHPTKRRRPIASGQLNGTLALASAVAFGAAGLALSFLLQRDFGIAAAVYVSIMVAYSTTLKHMVILDVMTIAGGFVLRAAAGGLAIHVPISPWLYLCTSLGALFIGFSKRRNELHLLGQDSQDHREVLGQYSVVFLDQLIGVVAPSTLIAYALYTFTATNLPANHAMMLTIPFVGYGIFRYLYLTHYKQLGGSPEEVLLSDKPLLLTIALWLTAAAVVLLVYD